MTHDTMHISETTTDEYRALGLGHYADSLECKGYNGVVVMVDKAKKRGWTYYRRAKDGSLVSAFGGTTHNPEKRGGRNGNGKA